MLTCGYKIDHKIDHKITIHMINNLNMRLVYIITIDAIKVLK